MRIVDDAPPKQVTPLVPPWLTDPEPDTWVPLYVAARAYFRKSYQTVWMMFRDGTFEEFGLPTFRLGQRIFVKLPTPIRQEDYPPAPKGKRHGRWRPYGSGT